MDWQKAPEHTSTEGEWWYTTDIESHPRHGVSLERIKVVKLFIPKGQKMWKATLDGFPYQNPYARGYVTQRWHHVHVAKEQLKNWL